MVNCTTTPENIHCVLTDTGAGLGAIFDGIAIPIFTLVLILTIAGAVGAILYGVAKSIVNKT